MERYFITSTGTGVGKTYVTALMARQFAAEGKKVRVLKPVISGFVQGEDNDLTVLGAEALYKFRDPVSPDIAAKREGKKIELAKIVEFCAEADEDVLLVEGVGGVMVPLNEKETVLDLIGALKFPVVLVVGSYLGTISHTLTALEVLKARGAVVDKIIISESEESGCEIDELQNVIENFAGIKPVFLPRGAEKFR